MNTHPLRLMSVLVCVVLLHGTAWAQSTLQVPLQFDFLNPGARSLSLGSAFTGLADDATSVFANPAGLVLLTRPEVSFEGRYRRITTPFLERGRVLGTVTNQGDDTVAGPQYSSSTADTFSPSFLSFVYPKGSWRFAGYRHELVKIRDSFVSRGVFTGIVREPPLDAVRNVDIANYGGSAAYRVNDLLSIGGGVSLYQLNLDSLFRRFGTIGMNTGTVSGPPDFSNELFRITQTGDDWAPGFNVGVHVTPVPQVRIGAVYRDGPDFDVEIEETLVTGFQTAFRTGKMRVPDVFSAGVMIRPIDRLTIAADYAYVEYTSLEIDYVVMQTAQRPERFQLENANEVHAGVEYVFTNVSVLPALRFGVWWDPDHSVTYVPTAANDAFDLRFSATLPGGEDLVHYTTGLGLAFNQQFELNVAFDLTSERKTMSSSVIYRFPR